MRVRHLEILSLAGATLLPLALAIGQETCVSFKSSSNSFALVSNKKAAPIFLSEDDWPGVQRTAFDFASDIEKVTGVSPSLSNVTSTARSSTPPVLVGTLGRSSLISAVLNHTNLDVSTVNGTWEAFTIKEVKNPLPGLPSALVIIGADKRGTIFGMYELSEQIGVSPWYWYVSLLNYAVSIELMSACD